MSSRTFLIDSSTRHAVFVQRFAGGSINELTKYVDRVRRQTKARLNKENLTDIGRRRLNSLLNDLNAITIAAYSQMGEDIVAGSEEFAEYEGDFSARMLTKGSEAEFVPPAVTALQAAVAKTTIEVEPGSRLTINKALKSFETAKAKEIVQTVKDGVVLGRTTQEVVSDLDSVVGKRQAMQMGALVRTITNQVSSVARQQTLEENRDIIKGVQWVSTLDGRTTAQCRSLDGKEFPVNKGPRPPIHWNCRSTVIPIVRDRYNLNVPSDRPSKGASGSKDVPGTTTYNSWLKKQPKSFQDDVLGPNRAKLFREGNLPMDKFVDRNFQPYTLDELKRKEPAAFEKAGLE